MRTLVCSTMLALTVAGCLTKAPVTATNPHPDLPANYRQVVADFMKTQQFAQIGGPGIRTAEISDPHRTWSGQDVVCVRFGGGGWPNFTFSGGQLLTFTGHIVSSYGQGVLTEAVACGSEPVFRPFPEWPT